MAENKFQLGDKVKFLNQVGGGVVTKITPDFIFVQDDSGFDMPMQASELIRMSAVKGIGQAFNDKHIADVAPQRSNVKPTTVELSPEDEIKQLRSQVSNLKDQVAKLQKQLTSLRQLNTRAITDNILVQHMTAPNEAEVDLHIDMLVEEPAKLSAHEVFEAQMRYFRTCMNHAIANKVKRIIFIHGVGRGILKDEITKELKQYDGLHFFDAPMAKYGVGATEVYFSNDVYRN